MAATRTLAEMKKKFADTEDVCQQVMKALSLMSNKTRFRILCVLAEGDFCVNEIVDTIQTGKLSNVSQQLRILTLSGVLEKTREQQRIIYHLTDRRLAKLIKVLEKEFG